MAVALAISPNEIAETVASLSIEDQMVPSFAAYLDYILPRVGQPQTDAERTYVETVTAAYRLGLAVGRSVATVPTRPCRICDGTGLESDAPGMAHACWPTRCPDCRGAGVVPLAVPAQFVAD